MKLLVAILVPQPAAGQITALQAKYGPSRWHIRIDPHITLIPPAEPIVGEEEAVNAFERLALGMEAFKVRCAGFGHFGTQTIYSRVESTQELTELWHTISEGTVSCILAEGKHNPHYTPHVTIANRLLAEEFDLVWPALQRQDFEYEFICREVGLFKLDSGDNQWQQISSAPLEA